MVRSLRHKKKISWISFLRVYFGVASSYINFSFFVFVQHWHAFNFRFTFGFRSFILRAKEKKFVALCAIRSNFYVRKSSKQLMQLTTRRFRRIGNDIMK